MADAVMRIDQAGLPAGANGKARLDGLSDGALVTLTSADPGTTNKFRLLDVPPGDTTSVASLAAAAPPAGPVWTFSPTAGVWGAWRIELIIDEGTATEKRQVRIFGVKSPTHGFVPPALGERGDPTASSVVNNGQAVLDATERNVDDLGADSVEGHNRELRKLADVAEVPQPPAAHVLGGAEHSADTLANLNAKISDATLDDASAARPPNGAAGGELGGTYPNPTVNDGADATAIHDDTAGEIAAVTEKLAPVAADLLLIEDSEAANAKKRVQVGNLPGGGGGFDADTTVDTANDAPTVIDTYSTLADDSAIDIEARIEGYNDVGTLMASFVLKGSFTRDNAGPGTVVEKDSAFMYEHRDDATWGLPDFNIVGQDIQVRVTGKAATDIGWRMRRFTAERQFTSPPV